MDTNGIVKGQQEKMINGYFVSNDKLSNPHNEENGYSCSTTTLGNPIELIRQNSYNPSSITTPGHKANMQRKTSIFSKVKTFFKI
jgi:hypothetical protein